MKELVARAILKTSQYLNEGYIHICEKLCEGVFTLDYLSLAIIDKKLIVHVSENTVNSNFMLVKKKNFILLPILMITSLYLIIILYMMIKEMF